MGSQLEFRKGNRPSLLQQVVDSIIAAIEERRRIRHLAFHDELTGLPNRYLFADRLAQALERARRTSERFAVLYVDVDRFKHVNDGFGHLAGDALLQHVASCLAATLRAGDTVARLGGDEFALVLHGVGDKADAQGAIDRIHEALRLPVAIDGNALSASCSIGYSIYPDDGVDANALLKRADLTMYACRRRNRAGGSLPAACTAVPCREDR